MVSLPERLLTGATAGMIMAPFMAGCGYFGGFLYARLSQLPPSQVALNWAIYAAASNAIRNLALSFFESEKVNAVIHATVGGAMGGYFISEMRKQGLMGKKLTICLIALHTLAILFVLAQLLPSKEAHVKG